MAQHTTRGADIVQQTMPLSGKRQIARAVRAHHERLDGTGYPDGLSGREIGVEARIISVVDSYDAMVSARAYNIPLSPEVAAQRLIEGAGREYDADVVAAFLRVLVRDGAIVIH